MTLATRRRATVVVVVAAVAVGAVVGAVANAAQRHGEAKTGIAATHAFRGTPALNKLKVQAALPATVASYVRQLAAFDHSDAARALAGVHLARSGANLQSTVYSFNDDRGNACVVVSGETGFCNPDGGTPTPGINWSIGGGDSQNPDRLIAVYSSDVSAVTLTADGASLPIAMSNNIAYGEFPASTKQTVLTVTYIDGTSRTINTNLTPFKG
jgi:hypothetical protein